MEASDGAMGQKWTDVLAGVATLADLLQTCQDAFGEDDAVPKVSATTKKRLAVRAMQGLQGGSQLIQALAANMRELQGDVLQQQEELQQANHSYQSLQTKLRVSDDECHSSKRALLQTESQKHAVQQQAEQLRQQLRHAMEEKQELQDTIIQLQSQLQGAAQQASDAHSHLGQLQQQMEQLAAAARKAEAGADAAAGALQVARDQADKEAAARARHEDVVARLTADNLVFMAQLKAAEAAAAAAAAECDELRLALEQHKGPWMDEVHQGVELRVKAAMARAEQLEAQLELAAAQRAQHTQQMQQQQADLEAALAAEQQQGLQLRQQLAAAQAAASEARTTAEEASVLAAAARAAADERAAELRVAQDSLRAMREECNERWMSERDARAQLAEVQERLDMHEASLTKLRAKLQARSDDLATQRAVNQQLMLKKEETEWQLLAAIAQLHNSTQVGTAAAAPAGSISPQDSLNAKQPPPPPQQQQQKPLQHPSAAPPAVNAADAHPVSPFEPSAQQPLSPVSPHPPPAAQLPAAWTSTAAAAGGHGSLPPLSAAGYFTAAGAGAAAAGPAVLRTGGLMRGYHELPGPAAMAAAGGLWQLPSGSSSGLFAGNNSGQFNSHTAAVFNHTPSAAAAAAAAGATQQAASSGSSGSLHHACSCPVGDLYSLPQLGFQLALLPTPQQLMAAAEAAAVGRGSLQKTVTIGRAGSLTVPMSADAGTAGTAGGTVCVAGSGSTAGGSTAAAGRSSAPADLVSGEGSGGTNTAAGVSGGLAFHQPSSMQPILLGTTGGLMAPYTPLSPGTKGPSSSVGRGSVFPECITASAVTDAEQRELGAFSFTAGLSDGLQQQQQQILGPGFWYLQQLQQQQLSKPQQQQRHGSSGSMSDSGEQEHHSSSPCNSSGSLHEGPHQLGDGAADLLHHSHATTAAAQGAGTDAANAVAVALAAAAAAAGDAGDAADHRNSNDSSGGGSGGSSHHGSNAQLHGILINGLHSRTRSPANGISPSGSMKSVRFSFDCLDGVQGPGLDADQEQQQDQKGSRRSSSSSRHSMSPQSRAHGRSGSEWLRQTLYQQLSSSTGTTPAPGSSPHGHERGVHGVHGGVRHHSSSSNRHPHGWPASSHPPAHSTRGAQHINRFAAGRQGHSSQQDLLRQQQRQARQQAAAKEVAVFAAAVKDRAQGKGAPVHPYFGAAAQGGGGAGSGAMAGVGTPPV